MPAVAAADMWVSWLTRSKSSGSRLNRDGAARLSSCGLLEEGFPLRLRKDLIEIIEVGPAGLAELLEQGGPALEVVVDSALGASVQAAPGRYVLLEQVAVAVARELEDV